MDKFEKEYFDKVYRGEYLRRNPAYKLNSFLKRILLFKKRGRLLDIGCAYGLFLKAAAGYFECEGIDVSRYAISFARKILPKNVKLHVGSIENMKFNKKFDVICCFDVLEHLPDVPNTLKVISAYLKPFGILVLTMPVYDGVVGRLVEFADKDETHIHKQGRDWWLESLETVGFRIEYFAGILRYFLFGRLYINWVSKLVRRASPAIYIIARK